MQKDGMPAIRLFAKLSIVVQDGAAHKELWGCRDGTRMCMKCLTIEASSELTSFDPSLKTNLLNVDQLEIQTIYWSFKELGHAILCKEDAWLCHQAMVSQIMQLPSITSESAMMQQVSGNLKVHWRRFGWLA